MCHMYTWCHATGPVVTVYSITRRDIEEFRQEAPNFAIQFPRLTRRPRFPFPALSSGHRRARWSVLLIPCCQSTSFVEQNLGTTLSRTSNSLRPRVARRPVGAESATKSPLSPPDHNPLYVFAPSPFPAIQSDSMYSLRALRLHL